LRLRVLGPLELRRDGAVLSPPELRRERVRQLMAYLLVHDRPTRAAITEQLWPDLDEPAAARNLRVTLAYLQNVLEPERDEQDPPYFLRSSGSVLTLVVDRALAVDAHEFESKLDEAAGLEAQGALSAALRAYQQATDLWGGEYFADVPDDGWLQRERDRLRDRFVAAAVRAGHLLLARGECTPARRLAERGLRADQWSEPGYQLLIAAQLAAGDRGSASRSLRHCQQMLHELGVRPQPQTLSLAGRLNAGR
jgi:DNA-binding SARP family transcriptional activator